MDTITLYSSQVYLAEDSSNPDSYIAKFIICDFGRNKNGVAIGRDGIGDWLSTLKNKPLVGKIKMRYDGTYDFTSHNMSVIKKIDDDGNEYQEVVFDTNAFGTFFDVSIEVINDIEYIVASCEIWKRFSKACEIIINRIQEGTLNTSWEIAVEKSKQGIVDGLMTKIIESGRFLGHCLLSKEVSPAYDSSGLFEIASTDYDVEFAEALSHDILSQGLDILKDQKKEDCILKKDEKNIVSSEEDVKEVPVEKEISTENTGETKYVKESSDAKSKTGAENTIKKKDDNDEPDDFDDDDDKKKPSQSIKKKKCGASEEAETSALTDCDLREKVGRACRDKIDKWCYVAFLFPEDHEVWCSYDGATVLEMLRFTYSVENDEVIVSDPEEVVLTVSVKDINKTIAEYEKTVAEKDELILKTSSEITSLKSENAELSQYKEKFTQFEQEKMEAELAEKKETLISSVVKSGQITRKEIEESEELSSYIDNLDKASLMSIVGERLIASLDKKTDKDIEVSERKDIHVASNLNNDDDTIDKASIMRKFLHK